MDLAIKKRTRKPAEKEVPLLRADGQLRAEYRFHNFGKKIFEKGGFEQSLIKWIKATRHKVKTPVDSYSKNDYIDMLNAYPEWKKYTDSVFQDAWELYIKRIKREGARKYTLSDLLGNE